LISSSDASRFAAMLLHFQQAKSRRLRAPPFAMLFRASL